MLARGPRFRLSAEAIRDAALAASGLLVEELGGPSVHPYQPPGLWKELTGGSDFVQDHGADLYRRSLYTFWKRTIAPPSMMTFDAAGREACTVRMSRTNTPLQALALLNEITFVEVVAHVGPARDARGGAGPGRADRAGLSTGAGAVAARGRAKHLWRLISSDSSTIFAATPAAAEHLLRFGEAPGDPRLDPAELAAYATVANLILNLDEMVTKE